MEPTMVKDLTAEDFKQLMVDAFKEAITSAEADRDQREAEKKFLAAKAKHLVTG